MSASTERSAFSHSISCAATLPDACVGAAGVASNRLDTPCGAAGALAAVAGFEGAAGLVLGCEPTWVGFRSLRMMDAMRSVALSPGVWRGALGTVRLVESLCTLRKIAAMRSLGSA